MLHVTARLKRFVENDRSLWLAFAEGQCEENILQHSIEREARHIVESKLPVVISVSHEATTLSIHFSQSQQLFLDECFADAL